ncbi:MAG: diaminopimelate epimerase [Prevotellaceae bacterium]|nr:diaminopimelate epimerase [Prevotellaceae bacterium]
MKRKIVFTKMHGAGNDYIYVDTTRFPLEHPEELSRRWSAPHTGIGSDGLVLIGSSREADFSMRIFNADGSEALMCGNASRCIGKYLYEKGLTDQKTIRLETLSGIKIIRLHLTDDLKTVETVTVDMGAPADLKEVSLEVAGAVYSGICVSMGNPHIVFFVDRLEEIDLAAVGPLIEHHPLFPDRINVEFASVREDGKIRMRVWERGSGITQACGTGACATAVATAFTGKTGREVVVVMDGGELSIHWEENSGHVQMTGTATTVYEGEIAID